MNSIGIKLADGSFYPVIEEGSTEPMALGVTTAKDNQTTVHIDLYNSPDGTMQNAQYVDTLEISNLNPHPNGEPNLDVNLSFDEKGLLHAQIHDPETGISSKTKTTIVSNSAPENTLISEQNNADTLSEETEMIGPGPNNEDFSFDELNKETLAQQGADEAAAAADDFEFSDQEESTEGTDISADFDLPDFDTETNASDDTALAEEPIVTEEPVIEETAVEEPVIEETALEDSSTDFDLPDFDTDGTATDTFDTGDTPADTTFDTNIADETVADDTPVFDDSALDSPIDDTNFDDTSSDFDLPDFDSDSTTDTTSEDAAVASGISGIFDTDFGEPDLSGTEEEPDFSSSDTGMFNDLYTDQDEPKKSKAPLIITLIVLILLLVAALLFLFAIPSKFNMLEKFKSHTPKETTVQDTPLSKEDTVPEPENPFEEPAEPEFEDVPAAVKEPEPQPVAKEDEIVISTTPMIPEKPAAPATKPQDIHYKIKWGDTLWDIANAYYKNPWRYHMLADYNGIKNPDHIISGDWIWIPAE